MDPTVVFQVAQHLQLTFTSAERTIREASEYFLTQLQGEPPTYCSVLIDVIRGDAFAIEVRTAAASNLHKFVCSCQGWTPDLKVYLAEEVYKTLVIVKNEPIRGWLAASFGALLSLEVTGEVLEKLVPVIVGGLQSNEVVAACRAINAAFEGTYKSEILYRVFLQLKNLVLEGMQECLNRVMSETSEFHVIVLEELTNTLKVMFEYFGLRERHVLKEIKDFYNVTDVFLGILQVSFNEIMLDKPNFFSLGEDPLKKGMNRVKTDVLQTTNMLLEFLTDNRKLIYEECVQTTDCVIGIDMPDSPFVNIFFGFLEPLLQYLLTLVRLPTIHSVLEEDSLADLVIQVLLLLEILATENKFRSFFDSNYQLLVVNVCFILMQSTQEDLAELEEYPDDFVHFSLDLCEEQESEHYKSSAVRCLKVICQNIDGALYFTTNYCCQLFQPEYSQSTSLPASTETCMEMGLLGLSVLWQLIGERPDLVLLLEDTIRSRWSMFSTLTLPLLQQRLCLFTHYLYEHLFVSDTEWSTRLLLLVVQYCLPPISIKTIQASQTIKHFFSSEDITVRLIEVLPGIFDQLIGLIQYQDHLQFFDALQEIVMTNVYSALAHLKPLFMALAQKIQLIYSQRTQTRNSDKSIICKCWNIIQFLAPSVDPNQLLELEQLFLPLFEYIQQPGEVEEELLSFQTTVIKRSQVITANCWSLVTQLPLIQEKYEGVFGKMLALINCVLRYGQFNEEVVNMIVLMCTKCLFAVRKNIRNEASNGEAALILHQVLFTFKGKIDSFLFPIYTAVANRLQLTIGNPFFTLRLLGVFCAGFYYNSQQTALILTEIGWLDRLFSLISDTFPQIRHKYDRKVLVVGLLSFLDETPACAYANAVFKLSASILSSYESEELSQENLEFAYLKLNNHVNSEEIEASLAVTTFLNPIEEIDEFEFFRHCLKKLEGQGRLREIVGGLSEGEATTLAKVVRSKTVELGGVCGTEVRRIVKAKKYK